MTTPPGGTAPVIVTATRSIDRAGLDQLTDVVQQRLRHALRPGSAVGVWVEDEIVVAAATSAALSAGGEVFVVPADATPARVEELCTIEDATTLLCDEERAGRLPDGVREGCGPGLVLAGLRSPSATGGRDGDGEGAVHFFTSGTDGRPRGLVRTRASLELEDSVVGGHLGMGPGCRVLCAVPVSHGYGFTAGLFAPLAAGGTAVLLRPGLPASLARALDQHEPEIVVGVPAQYAAWSRLRQPRVGHVPRIWLCGGAPLPAAVRSRFQEAWGGVIAEQYGMTETGAVCVDLDGAGTLGRPYPGVSVSIAGAVGPGQVGEVLVGTPYRPRRFAGSTSAPCVDPLVADPFRTGDAGWLDDHGRLHLLGRRAHQLNVRGKKVDPLAVEQVYWSLAGVSDVAVVGVDRDDGDQWVAAFVVCTEDVGDDTLHRATAHLEGHLRPQRVIRLPALPKTSIGKTDHARLRALATST